MATPVLRQCSSGSLRGAVRLCGVVHIGRVSIPVRCLRDQLPDGPFIRIVRTKSLVMTSAVGVQVHREPSRFRVPGAHKPELIHAARHRPNPDGHLQVRAVVIKVFHLQRATTYLSSVAPYTLGCLYTIVEVETAVGVAGGRSRDDPPRVRGVEHEAARGVICVDDHDELVQEQQRHARAAMQEGRRHLRR